MKSIREDIDRYLATVAELLDADSLLEAADLLRTATPRLVETGFDNWNGGTTIWMRISRMPAGDFTASRTSISGMPGHSG